MRIYLRAPVNEDFYNFCVSFLCSLHQCGLTDEVSGVHVRTVGKQGLKYVALPLACCLEEILREVNTPSCQRARPNEQH